MMQATAPRIGVGEPAPLFALPSIQGATVDLAAYRGRLNVIVWLSRGFTCPFCLMYMDGIRAGYEQLLGTGSEVEQVGGHLDDLAPRAQQLRVAGADAGHVQRAERTRAAAGAPEDAVERAAPRGNCLSRPT